VPQQLPNQGYSGLSTTRNRPVVTEGGGQAAGLTEVERVGQVDHRYLAVLQVP
jgi:hypothetical protein